MVIRQIHGAADNFQLFGLPSGMASIVAIVRNIDRVANKTTITLDDHTGRLEAHSWLKNMPMPKLNSYARATGKLKFVQGSPNSMLLFKIEPLESINQLTTHLLEVLNARYSAEKNSKNTGADGVAANQSNTNENEGEGEGSISGDGGGANVPQPQME